MANTLEVFGTNSVSSYHDRFKREWLFESPIITGPSSHDPYPDLVNAIKTNIDAGNIPDESANGLKKLELGNQITYWIEQHGVVEIITQFEKTAHGLFVEITGKRKGSTIYASKFYEMILADAGRLIFSGDLISDEGFGIWRRLFKDGKKLFVYNMSNIDQHQTIDNEDDLQKYLNNKNYRFVLSESVKQHSTVTTSFNLLRTYNLTFNLKGLD